VKKGIVALLVVLAVVILVSPGLIGRLAEKSVDENLNWAATESGDLIITSAGFDRGWFSSEGQHRIEIKPGQLRSVVASDSGEVPVFVIDTHLDHGLVPFSSMSREKGSLAPGLGSAVSTVSIEVPGEDTIELPGKIFSKVALGGELQSNYVLQAGSHEQDETTASWGDSSIDVTTNPSTGNVDYAGNVGSVRIEDDKSVVTLEGLSFSGTSVPTSYGFATGDIRFELDTVSMESMAGGAGGLKGLSIDATTSVDAGEVSGHTLLNLESQTIPGFGEVSVAADVTLAGADAKALGALHEALDDQGAGGDPNMLLAAVDDELMRLLAGGLELRFDKFDVTLPMGTVMTKIDIRVAEEDPDTFVWTSLLQSTEASADITVPEALVDMAMQMNPQAGAVVGMGFLKKNGDVYEMEAEYKKGLLTINGAPMPIPLGGMQ